MKAIVIPKPYEIEIREVPMPQVKEGEALLRVRCVGIASTAVKIGIAGNDITGPQSLNILRDLHDLSREFMTGDPGIGGKRLISRV